jgi:hypothetical protein
MTETELTSQAILDVLPSLLVTVHARTGVCQRVRSSDLMAALGCDARPLVLPMRALGFMGPRTMRFPRPNGTSYVVGGYERPTPQHVGVDDVTDVVPVGGGADVIPGDQSELAAELVAVTRKALRKANVILSRKTDFDNAGLLRAQVTMCSAVMGTAARVDIAQLRRRHETDVIQRLEKLMAEQRRLLPKHIDASGETSINRPIIEHNTTEGV